MLSRVISPLDLVPSVTLTKALRKQYDLQRERDLENAIRLDNILSDSASKASSVSYSNDLSNVGKKHNRKKDVKDFKNIKDSDVNDSDITSYINTSAETTDSTSISLSISLTDLERYTSQVNEDDTLYATHALSNELEESKEIEDFNDITLENSDDIPETISPLDYKRLKRLRTHGKSERIRQQAALSRLVQDSNRRFAEVLTSTFQAAVDNDGVDLYTYFNYVNRIRDNKISDMNEQSDSVKQSVKSSSKSPFNPSLCIRFLRILLSLPGKIYTVFTVSVILAIQLFIPILLLAVQLLVNSDFTPANDNFWFRLVGFFTMSHSTAVLRKQIVDQVSWNIINNNKILNRIDSKIPKPHARCLYVGLYINLFMSLVVTTNIYLLFCQSSTLLDLILNMLALNFLLYVDNDAFKMMANNDKIKEIILEDAKNQIDTMVERANHYEVRMIRRSSHILVEYIIFYIVAFYSMALPLCFLFYHIKDVSFGAPCLGVGNETC